MKFVLKKYSAHHNLHALPATKQNTRSLLFVTLYLTYGTYGSPLGSFIFQLNIYFVSRIQALFRELKLLFPKWELRFQNQELVFWNQRFFSRLLFQFEFKISFPELKHRFQNRSFVSNVILKLKFGASFLEQRFVFWNRRFDSRIGASNLSCNSKLEPKLQI